MSNTGTTCHYLILAVDNQWWVDREGKPYGLCASQQEATAAAMRLIDILEDQGRKADIWAPDDSGKTRRVGKVLRPLTPPAQMVLPGGCLTMLSRAQALKAIDAFNHACVDGWPSRKR